MSRFFSFSNFYISLSMSTSHLFHTVIAYVYFVYQDTLWVVIPTKKNHFYVNFISSWVS